MEHREGGGTAAGIRLLARLRSDRTAVAAFGGLLVAAIPIVLLGFGHDQYFRSDIWEVFYGRNLTVHGLLDPFHGHCIALPIIGIRLLFRAFGVRYYLPYHAWLLSAHLAVCILLRVIMRRCGVRAWPATIVAGVFVFLGSGRLNMLASFQVTLVGSLALGLLQLILVDHTNPKLTRRDLWALLTGLAALGFSNTAVCTIVASGIVVLVKRGWKPAAFQILPLGGIFLTWYLLFPAAPYGIPISGTPRHKLSLMITWVRQSYVATFRGLGLSNWGLTSLTAAALTLVIIVGVILKARRTGSFSRTSDLITPVSLAISGIVFVVINGTKQAGASYSSAGLDRYIYLSAAFLLPLLAVAVNQLMGYSRYLAAVIVVVLLLGTPANFLALRPTLFEKLYAKSQPAALYAFAASPGVQNAEPDTLITFNFFMPPIPAQWLAKAYRSGRIAHVPVSAGDHDIIYASMVTQLGIQQTPYPSSGRSCRIANLPGLILHPKDGEEFGIYPIVGGSIQRHSFPNPITIHITFLDAQDRQILGKRRMFELSPSKGFRTFYPGLHLKVAAGFQRLAICT